MSVWNVLKVGRIELRRDCVLDNERPFLKPLFIKDTNHEVENSSKIKSLRFLFITHCMQASSMLYYNEYKKAKNLVFEALFFSICFLHSMLVWCDCSAACTQYSKNK